MLLYSSVFCCFDFMSEGPWFFLRLWAVKLVTDEVRGFLGLFSEFEKSWGMKYFNSKRFSCWFTIAWELLYFLVDFLKNESCEGSIAKVYFPLWALWVTKLSELRSFVLLTNVDAWLSWRVRFDLRKNETGPGSNFDRGMLLLPW